MAETNRLPLSNEDGFNETDTEGCLTIQNWTFCCLLIRWSFLTIYINVLLSQHSIHPRCALAVMLPNPLVLALVNFNNLCKLIPESQLKWTKYSWLILVMRHAFLIKLIRSKTCSSDRPNRRSDKLNWRRNDGLMRGYYTTNPNTCS